MAPSSESPRLSNTDFLSRLTTLFTTTHTSNAGSVFLTQKPLFPSSSSPTPDNTTPSNAAPQILIRATDGKSPAPHSKSKTTKSGGAGVRKKPLKGASGNAKVKFSTVVEASDLEAFFAQYADVCKAGMQGLRKRDRKKAKKRGKGATAAGAAGAAGGVPEKKGGR